MIVVGIDPGIRSVGWSVIDCDLRGGAKLVDMGAWDLSKLGPSVGTRLERLHEESVVLIQKWNPRFVGLEKAVNFKNVDSAFKLSEARAVIRLACYQNLADMDERMIEISPTAIKKHASGSGRSTKDDMLRTLKLRFANLDEWMASSEKKLPHDAIDALGISWTTWVRVRQKIRLGSSMNSLGGRV
ncbi:MAG: crossover junction endodeoxyribonuclease RuvC [Bdellovibrionota bacterium]